MTVKSVLIVGRSRVGVNGAPTAPAEKEKPHTVRLSSNNTGLCRTNVDTKLSDIIYIKTHHDHDLIVTHSPNERVP